MSSQTQPSLLLLAIPILLLLFSIRGRWLYWKNEDHQLKTVWYCWRTGQQESVLLELLEIWPTRTMLLELWNWNFDRYIIHHDHLEEMKKFIARELTRDDINLDMMRQAQLQYSNKDKPKDPTSPSWHKDQTILLFLTLAAVLVCSGLIKTILALFLWISAAKLTNYPTQVAKQESER